MKKQTTKSTPVNVYRDHVAGVQYSDYQLISIKDGDEIELRRETKNPADANAIAVYIKDTRIGYIKRPHNQRLIGLKRDGAVFSGRVVSYNKNNPSWQAIVISVDVTLPEANEKDGEIL
jgi:hypothetical protein